MNQIRTGIIGLGRSGRDIHGEYLANNPDMYKIVAVSDPLEERCERALKEFNCDVYSEYKDMLERDDLDLIINASPSHLHVPISIELLNKRFNVLCEKPLAFSTKEADLLIEAANKSEKVLSVFQNMRFAPCLRQIEKVAASGVLGRIVQISMYADGFYRRWDMQTMQKYKGGNLLNLVPHTLDQALQLFGWDTMPEVTCRLDRANTFGDADDYAKLILRAPGRPIMDIEVSSCCAYPPFTYNIQGTCGGLTGSPTQLKWMYFKPEEAPVRRLVTTPLVDEKEMPAYCNETLKWYEECWEFNDNDFQEARKGFYNMLYRTITEGTPLVVTPQQVRLQIAILEECVKQNPLLQMAT